MSADAYRRAEACFAVARRATFPGERENALKRGLAIAERAGLDLDRFDIPGRKRTEPVRPDAVGMSELFQGSGIYGANFEYVRPWGGVSADEIFAEINRMLREGTNQRERVAEERRRRWELRVELASQFLRSRGNAVRQHGDGTYSVGGHHSPDERVDGETIILAAKSRGWRG